MKKLLLNLTMFTFAIACIVSPIQKANALVGIFCTPVAIAGAASLTIGVGSFVVASNSDDETTQLTLGLVGIAYSALGIVLLDEKNGNVEFKKIARENYDQFDASPEELDQYNSRKNLARANAVLETAKRAASLQNDNSSALEVSKQIWTTSKKSLNPDSVKVIEEIANNFVSKQ